MKNLKIAEDGQHILVVTDAELQDLKNAVYTAMKANDELSKTSEADHHGSAHRTANRLEVLYNEL